MTTKSTVTKLVEKFVAGTGIRSACKQISNSGPLGVNSLLDALEGKHGPVLRCRHPRDLYEDLVGGLWAIASINPGPLIGALDHRPQHALALIWALGGSRNEAAVAKLIEFSKHKDLWVRWAAVEGLGRYKKKSLLPTLLEALRDRSDTVRFSALIGLTKIADRRAIEPLKQYLARKRLQPGGRRLARELLDKLEIAER